MGEMAEQRRADDVGLRLKEAEDLRAWLESPHGSVVLIKGRRGVGKNQLAEEIIRHAHQLPKTVVLEGRTPVAGGRSFHPFAEIAHQAMHWAEQNGVTEALIDPLYVDLSPVLEHPTLTEDNAAVDHHKLRFFESFRALLVGIGRWARPAIVVHDLERADSDTLELTSYLADELFADPELDPDVARPGLLMLLARDDNSTSDIVRDTLQEIESYRSTRTMSLQGLDIEGLRSYVQSPHVLEKLLAASDGLPQELDAIFEALPTNVEELFQRRLIGLDPIAQETLRALAVSGRPAAARTLAHVVQHPLKQVAKTLNDLREARIVDRRVRNGEFQFSYARRRDLEVTETALSAEDRQRFHRGWADALTKEPDQADPALLAHHQLRSSEPQRGVALAVRAAESYAVAGALNAAVHMLESAHPYAQGELRLTIATRLADLTPMVGAPKRALRHVDELKKLMPDDQRGLAFLREAKLHNNAGDHDRALQAIDEARRLVPESSSDDRAAIEGAASEAHYHRSSLEQAEAAAQAGLKFLGSLESASTAARARLVNQLGKIALARADYATALSYYEQNLSLATKAGLQSLQAMAHVNISIVLLRRGEPGDAERHLDACLRTAREIGDLPTMAFASMTAGGLHHQRGQLGRAIEAYRECRSLFRRLGNRTQLARALHNLATLYLVCGDVTRAKAYNNEAYRLAKQSGVGRILALATVVDGLLEAESGAVEMGEARLREGMHLQSREGVERPIETMIELAEFQLRFRSVGATADILDEVERGLELHDSAFLRARAALMRGRLMVEQGDDKACEVLMSARDRFVELDRRLFVRDAEIALARCLLRRGQREACRFHLRAARVIQDEVAAGLPSELGKVFTSAPQQRTIGSIEDELDGRASRAEIEPTPTSIEPARAVSTRRSESWSGRYDSIIGESSKLHRVFKVLDRIAGSDDTVLVYGESGTGKELVAEAIHRNSPRADGPFVKLNCAALVESLLLSELFGHERGSFTGAHQRKIGRFEMAAGGTIFLDEIGDISPKTQVALLRVLQEREFERVGGGKPIKVDARIIFATNRNLPQMVREGTFREDLYYRLRGICIDLPPLRERPEDIRALADHFLNQYAAESGSVAKQLSKSAMALLVRYSWPGNIRELENIVRSVALLSEGQIIEGRDFDDYRELFRDHAIVTAPAPQSAASAEATKLAQVNPSTIESDIPSAVTTPRTADEIRRDLLLEIFAQGVPLPELKKRIQEQAIAQALQMTQGNITRAAEVLGMRRPRLSQIINANDELKALTQGVSR